MGHALHDTGNRSGQPTFDQAVSGGRHQTPLNEIIPFIRGQFEMMSSDPPISAEELADQQTVVMVKVGIASQEPVFLANGLPAARMGNQLKHGYPIGLPLLGSIITPRVVVVNVCEVREVMKQEKLLMVNAALGVSFIHG
jgi:hypothetical protein